MVNRLNFILSLVIPFLNSFWSAKSSMLASGESIFQLCDKSKLDHITIHFDFLSSISFDVGRVANPNILNAVPLGAAYNT